MTLNETTVLIKKTGIISAIGIVVIIFIVIGIRVGITVKNALNPPKIDPPSRQYGQLPHIQLPKNAAEGNFTYSLQTTTGELPADLPSRLSIFPIRKRTPNFLDLDIAKQKVDSLDFTAKDGKLVQEIQLTNPYYEWDERKDFNRKIILNINSFDFKMTSEYLQSLTVLSAQHISDEQSAISTTQSFLSSGGLTPSDLDIKKTNTRHEDMGYVTYPQLFSIQTGAQGNSLISTTSLSKTQVIRVDSYQKDVEYDLNTGQAEGFTPTVKVKIPILYPQPPYSTMSFWVASGQSSAVVTQAFFTHQGFDIKDTAATYQLKTVEEAFEELKIGQAYIASYSGNDADILLKNVFLGYYLEETPQEYLMPIYVFEGNDGFFAYISALTPDQIAN